MFRNKYAGNVIVLFMVFECIDSFERPVSVRYRILRVRRFKEMVAVIVRCVLLRHDGNSFRIIHSNFLLLGARPGDFDFPERGGCACRLDSSNHANTSSRAPRNTTLLKYTPIPPCWKIQHCINKLLIMTNALRISH